MEKVWIRLGGYVSASPERMKLIMAGDATALREAIRTNGFELDGESYIPLETGYDITFEL